MKPSQRSRSAFTARSAAADCGASESPKSTSDGPSSPSAWSLPRWTGGLRSSASAMRGVTVPGGVAATLGGRTRPGLALPGSMAAAAEILRERDLLTRLAAGTSGVVGAAFLRRLVAEVAAALDTEVAFVAELCEQRP